MNNATNVYDQLSETGRDVVATLLCSSIQQASFRNLLRDTPAVQIPNPTFGDYARAVHAQLAVAAQINGEATNA